MTESEAVAREFWRRMASNDFASVAGLLAEGFVCDWPQSGERIAGAEAFVRVNAEYPAHGRWRFDVRRVVGGAGEAVSEVAVTDGVLRAVAVSFFTVEDGRIARLREYWPDPFDAPEWRAHLVERMPEG
jgi:ketosteroid isomerase-like protein